MKIALLGTRGVPARYGGFETAVEEIGSRLVDSGHEVIVYGRREQDVRSQYKGMERIEVPAVPLKQLETLSRSATGAVHVAIATRPDVVFLFNAANYPLIRPMRRAGIPVAIHVDGLEFKREKWRGLGSKYYAHAERASVRRSDAVIADSIAIRSYLSAKYGTASRYIPYGAPDVSPEPDVVTAQGLTPRAYHLVVARFEPKNHVLDIVEAYSGSSSPHPLIVVGSGPYSERYSGLIAALAHRDRRIQLLGPVWDQHLLDQLYANCLTYQHGHSVGGTNPSLLRAAGAGAPIIAWDVPFNREVIGTYGRYFSDSSSYASALSQLERSPSSALQMGQSLKSATIHRYSWAHVADEYEQLAIELATAKRYRWKKHRC